MPSLDSTAVEAVLREYIKSLESETFAASPILSTVQKDTSATGEDYHQPIKYASSAAVGGNFVRTQDAKQPSKYTKFVVPWVNWYGLGSITTKVIRQTRNDAGALITASKSELASAHDKLKHKLSRDAFGDGTGVMGRIGSISTDTVTLATTSDAANFEVGDTVCLVDGAGAASAAARDSADTLTITKVNRRLGTITTNSDWSDITGATADDWIVRSGDIANNGDLQCIYGLASWVPDADPASTAFNLVDRSVDTRLGGNRVLTDGQSYSDALIDMLEECDANGSGRGGPMPMVTFVNPRQFGAIAKELGSLGERDVLKVPNVKIGLKGLSVCLGARETFLTVDHGCPQNKAYAVNPNSITLASLGEALGVLGEDGLGSMVRESGADANEFRIGGFGCMATGAPGDHCVHTKFGL